MIEIFKIGDHVTAGISTTYFKGLKTYQTIITLAIFHFIISIPKNGIRLGFQIGNHELHIKLSVGID